MLAVYVFRPNKWQPVFQKEKVLENPVISATFLPQAAASNQSAAVTKDSGELGWQQKHRLYLLDSKQQLFTPEYLSDVTSTHRATSQTRVSTSGDDDTMRDRVEPVWAFPECIMMIINAFLKCQIPV